MAELTVDQALERGIEAHKAGQVHVADRFYTAILKAVPNHSAANHNMGLLVTGLGNLKEALPFLKKALEANSSVEQYWVSYVDALVKLGQIKDAQERLEKAESKGLSERLVKRLEELIATKDNNPTPGPPQEIINRLVNLYNNEQLTETVEQAQALTGQYPDAFIVWNILGAAQQGLGRVFEAIQTFKNVTALNPNYADGFNNLGVALQDEGKLEEAVEAYNKALAINPRYSEAYNNLGNALKDQGELEEAIEAYNNALLLKPDYAQAYNNMGLALKNHGRLVEALDAYKKAIAQKINCADVHYNMGNILRDQGKLEEAVEAYHKALSIKPNHAETYNNMGNTLKDQGKLDKAIDAYNKALSLKPNYTIAYSNAVELLKIYSPKDTKNNILFQTNQRIKKIGSKVITSNSDKQIELHLLEALDCINEEKFDFKTHLSQIYRHNSIDLNCRRHSKIFKTKKIIPEFCFGCFKVQVEVDDLFSLVRLSKLFYDLDLEVDLTRKTMVEMRPDISGFYKGLFYCRGLDQARAVKKSLDVDLNNIFDKKLISQIKRGCSEFPIKFPDYGQITSEQNTAMDYPIEWKFVEDQFDRNSPIKPNENVIPSIPGFCLSDFYIIQKWIDYAKGLDDPSCKKFEKHPIIFKEIYDIAVMRKAKYGKVFK